LIVVANMAGIFLTPTPWQRVGWLPIDVVWGLVATVPLLVGLFVMRRVRTGPLARLNTVVDQFLTPLFSDCSVAQLALISIVAGIGEELMFRGVIQPVLISWLNVIAGVIIASIIFGLLHAVTTTYAVLATIVGAYFGWLTLATGHLLAPMIAHSLYD